MSHPHPYLQMLLARARADDLYRDAATTRRVGEARRAAQTGRSGRARGHRRSGLSADLATPQRAVTLRRYSAEDHGPLARLAALDSSKPPSQPLVVAEVEGELRVALSLSDGSLVADPFHLTQGVAELLRAYARQFDTTAARNSAASSSTSPAMLCVEGGVS
jgi:hypothetical protein